MVERLRAVAGLPLVLHWAVLPEIYDDYADGERLVKPGAEYNDPPVKLPILPPPRPLALVPVWAVLVAILAASATVRADTNAQVAAYLTTHDVFVTHQALPSGALRGGARGPLQRQVDAAGRQQVPEKFAIVRSYPSNFHSPAQAAEGLRNFLDFSGVLVLVSPEGIGVASDMLSSAELSALTRQASPHCRSDYVACALFAAQTAAVQVRHSKNSAFHQAALFWLAFLIGFGLVVAVLLTAAARRRALHGGRGRELRDAAIESVTLADASLFRLHDDRDNLSPELAAGVQEARQWRDRAARSLDEGGTAQLVQANESAAKALVILHDVLRQTNTPSPLVVGDGPQDTRCVYCGRDDRPPYADRTVEDGKGHSLKLSICAHCATLLERGATPAVATGLHADLVLPWWAILGNRYYEAYGGFAWQYWIPYLVGLDVLGWLDTVAVSSEVSAGAPVPDAT